MKFNIFRRENVVGRQPTDNIPSDTSIGGNFAGEIEHADSRRQSPTVSAWYRGVEIRANAASQLRAEVQRLDRAGGNYCLYNYGDFRHINYLLQVRPNPYENAAQMAKRKELMKIYDGNAYIYVKRDIYGRIDALYLCNSGSYNALDDTYNVTYSPHNYSADKVPSSDIIHLRNTFTEDSGMRGIGTLKFAARALNISATNEKQSLDVASKGGRFKVLLTQAQERMNAIGGKLNTKQMEDRRQKMLSELYSGDVGVVPYGTDVKNISMNMQDMQLLENRRFSVPEVARFLGVPPSMLMDTTNANYKTSEHATLELFRTLSASIHEEELEYTSKLLGEDAFGVMKVHLCEKPLFRLDLASQASWNMNRLQTGVATVNELRNEQDMPSVEGGDMLLLSANLKSFDMLRKEGSAPSSPITEGGNDEVS